MRTSLQHHGRPAPVKHTASHHGDGELEMGHCRDERLVRFGQEWTGRLLFARAGVAKKANTSRWIE